MEKKYNYGIGILRAFMCFEVILYHFWNSLEYTNSIYAFPIKVKTTAVPVFMILSFVYAKGLFNNLSSINIRKRFSRLVVPHIGWAICYWLIFEAIDIVFKQDNVNGGKDLLAQLVIGQPLNSSMWFQATLIYLTVIFVVILLCVPKTKNVIFILVTLIVFGIEYSGVNRIIDGVGGDVGRFLEFSLEMIPYSIVGYYIAQNDILDKLKKYWYVSVPVSLVFLNIALKVDDIAYGYSYEGLVLLVRALSFIVVFYSLPIEKLPSRACSIIKYLSNYTLGIYCMHRLFGKLYVMFVYHTDFGLELYTFSSCVALYILCFVMSLVGSKIFKNTFLKQMFE